MAILNAIAAGQGSSLLNILQPLTENEEQTSARPLNVRICALLDAKGTPSEVAYVAGTLVKEGFTAIKLKVSTVCEYWCLLVLSRINFTILFPVACSIPIYYALCHKH